MQPIVWWELGLSLALALSFALGMAHRAKTRAGRAEGHRNRRRLLDQIRHRPGSSITQLWKELGMARGTVQYHVVILQDARLVETIHYAGATRCFPGGTPDAEGLALLQLGRVRYLADAVASRPGTTQRDLLRRLPLSRKVFRDYADRLIEAGLVTEETGWRTRRYFPTTRLQDLLPRMGGRPEHQGDAPDARPPKGGGPNGPR